MYWSFVVNIPLAQVARLFTTQLPAGGRAFSPGHSEWMIQESSSFRDTATEVEGPELAYPSSVPQ